MSDTHEELTREQLRRGLRVAVLVVTATVVFGLGLSNLLRGLAAYDLPLAQLGAFAVLAAVVAVEAVLVVRRRPWGWLRRPAVAVVLAASAASYVTLPEGRTSTTVDWMFGVANWVGVAVLLDRPLRKSVAFLVAHELTALLNLLLFDHASRAALARFATGSVTVFGFPLCVAVVAAALRSLGEAAAAAAAELERVRTAEAVAAASHRHGQQRFAELSVSAVPLLAGLADGSLTPADPDVQQRCAIEAARMRRLFAEVDTVANPLLHELEHCADVAGRKGVVVELDTRGQWPTPPVAVRRDLTEAALTALATAATWARVTVVGSAEEVSVSVVADCGEVNAPRPVTPGVQVETFSYGNTIWTEVRWRPTQGQVA